jgi:hypothetical protein
MNFVRQLKTNRHPSSALGDAWFMERKAVARSVKSKYQASGVAPSAQTARSLLLGVVARSKNALRVCAVHQTTVAVDLATVSKTQYEI